MLGGRERKFRAGRAVIEGNDIPLKLPNCAELKPEGQVAAARTHRDRVPMRNGISATGRERSAIC